MTSALFRFALIGGLSFASFPSSPIPSPETVLITLHAKPGADSALRAVIDGHWATLERLKLAATPRHTTLRGTETGGVYFVEIFTWRDSAIPDNAPPEVRAWWEKMGALTESRGGKPGIDILELTDVTAATAASPPNRD